MPRIKISVYGSIDMRLRMICESGQYDLKEAIYNALPDHAAKSKLIEWAFSKNTYTKYNERHTSAIISKELKAGHRLVGNPWKEDVDEDELQGFEVVDYGNQLMVSLPDNSDVIDYVINADLPETHIVRGLAFGYPPDEVYSFYKTRAIRKVWKEFVIENGATPMTEYGRGYNPAIGDNSGSVYVYPQDLDTLDGLISKFKVISVKRWCPHCRQYVSLKGPNHERYKDDPNYEKLRDLWSYECEHEPEYYPFKDFEDQHWYAYEFDLSKVKFFV